VHVLEEEDRAVEVDLPRRAHRLHEKPETAADERCGNAPTANRPYPRVVRIPGYVAGTAAA